VSDLELPPVNRAYDPLLCDHGVAAKFENESGAVTLSVLCELMVGHVGDHFAQGAGYWSDNDPG
jgi:hypothetical protein